MAKIKLKSTALSSDPEVKAPVFRFNAFSPNTRLENNSEYIDFVTDEKSLYVCAIDGGVTGNTIGESSNILLKIVSQGEKGEKGTPGINGAAGITPQIDAEYIDVGNEKKLALKIDGKRKAMTGDLTPPVYVPTLVNDRYLTWEWNGDEPATIDLMKLRPINERPILLRTNSDNTKLDAEVSGPANFIQWKYEGDENWTNLISIQELMNLAFAGMCTWEAADGKWHFGYKEVVKATYDSTKSGRRIINRVELGQILFDAGEIPLQDYGVEIEMIEAQLEELKNSVQSISIDGGRKLTPDKDGNVNLDLSDYAKKSEIPESVDAYTKAQSDTKYQPKGNYLTQHQSLKTINGQSLVGTGNITISAGSISLFDIKIENGHLYKTSDGQNWTDLGAIGGSGSGEGCPECWTREQIQSLIDASLEGLNLPDEWVTFADLNRFITISDLADYATKNYVESRIQDAMTDQGDLDYYRIFTLYQRTNSRTTAPNAPVQGNFVWDTSKGEIVLQPTFTSNWENHPQNATSDKPYLWQATATYSYKSKSEIKGDDETEYWHVVCLTGEPGNDGSDGNGVEFIYTLVDSLAEFNALTTPIAPGTGPDSYPDPWQDHPEGVSEEHPIEAASVRKYNGVTEQWEAYCEPFIWSKWGEDGVDGDGVEYIFHVDASDTLSNNLIPAQTLEDIYYTTNSQIDYSRPKPGYENYDTSDWVPDGQNGRPDQNWSDNPSDVDEQQPYEWVSIRKYNGQTGHWGPFSEPKIWGLWGQKTVIQQEVVSGTTVYKSYNCYAFTRTNLDISGYRVTGGQAYDDPLDGIVTKNGNTTVQMTWFDGIPNGTEQLWSIQALIGDESQSSDAAWSSPARVGDRPGFQVEFAASNTNTDAVYNKTKTLPSLNNYIADTPEGVDEVAWRNATSTINCGSWSDTSDDNTVYMAESRIVAGSWTPWNVIKIKGEKGEPGEGLPGTPGADGTDVEFVYFRTDSEDHRPGMSETYGTYDGETRVSEDLYKDDFLPMVTASGFTLTDNELKIGNDFFWHDHPAGVNESLTCEWVGMRHSSYQNGQKLWGEFNIALWSKFGADGRDGDGIEYVFWGVDKNDVINETWPTQKEQNEYNNNQNVNPDRKDSKQRSITASEYLPAVRINGSYVEAVDDNPGIANNTYVYASMRKYNGTTKTWGEFSEIKLWNEQNNAELESIILDITDDSHSVQVDSNGRILDRYMDSTKYDTDGMYLYKNNVLLSNGDISINNVKIAELIPNAVQSNCYSNTNNSVVVTSNGITATVTPYWVWKYENSNSSSVQLRVVFDQVNNQNPVLNESFDIPIKVQSADGQYAGLDILRIIPRHSDKDLELSRVPGTQRTSEEGGKTYSNSEFNFYGYYGDTYVPLSLIEKTHFYFKYDDQSDWTEFYIPSDNSGLVNLRNEVDGKRKIQSGEGYFYFDRNGNILSNSTNAFYKIWLYNRDWNDNIHGEWTNWSMQADVISSSFTATEDYPKNELYFGIGFDDNIILDEANVHIIYPGKNGQKGDKGDTVEKMYFLTNALEPYNNAFGWLRTDYDTHIGDYMWPCLANTRSISTTINENTVYYLNISGDEYATTAMSKNIPSVDSTNKYRWVIERSITYSGNTPSYGEWSIPVLDSQPGPQGDPGEVVITYQYLDGKVVRMSNWTDNQLEYSDGETAVDGVYYLDVVKYVSGSTTSYYKCISDVTYTSSNKPSNPSTDSTHWEVFTPQSDAWFETMLANSAYIENLTSKQVVITDNNTIVAGMASGADIAAASDNQTVGNVRIWAGTPTTSGDLTTAPFTVNANGSVRASNIDLAGGSISGYLNMGSNGGIALDGNGSSSSSYLRSDGLSVVGSGSISSVSGDKVTVQTIPTGGVDVKYSIEVSYDDINKVTTNMLNGSAQKVPVLWGSLNKLSGIEIVTESEYANMSKDATTLYIVTD